MLVRLLKTLVLFSFVFSSLSFAAQGPQSFTLDGILKQAGTNNPLLDPAVTITVQIMDPTKQCLLYEEQQTVSTSTSKGYFNIVVGSDLGSPKRTGNDPGLATYQIYQNSGSVIASNVPGQTCAGGLFTPVTQDYRYMRIIVTPSSTGVADTLSPDTLMDAVPAAVVAEWAESVGGFTPNDLLKVNVGAGYNLSQVNLESLFTNAAWPNLQAVAAGNFMNKTANNGAALPTYTTGAPPAAPAEGSIWFDSDTNQIKYYDGAATQIVGTSGMGVTSVDTSLNLTVDNVAGGSITSTGTLDLSNTGVVAGTYPKVQVDAKGRVLAGTATLLETDLPAVIDDPGRVSGDAITSGTIGGSTSIATTGTVSAASASFRQIDLYDSDNSNYVRFVTPATGVLTSNYTLTFPANAGTSGQALTTDGSGGLAWTTIVTDVGNTADLGDGLVWIGDGAGTAQERAISGDIAITNAGVATIQADTVTYAKIQNVTDNRLLGRSAGSAGDVQEIQVGTGLTMAAGTIALTDTTDDDTLGGLSCANNELPRWNGAAWVCQLAASTNTGSALVLRDAGGSFAATNITAARVDVGDGSNGQPTVTFTNDQNTGLFRPIDDALAITTAGTERMRVESNGRVGIGITNPAYPLDVVGRINSSTIVSVGSTSNAGEIQFRRGSDGNNVGRVGFPTTTEDNDFSFRHIGGGGYFTFVTNDGTATEKMRIGNAGNVGIGTTNPATKLDVAGNITLGTTGAAGNLRLRRSDGAVTGTIDANNGLNLKEHSGGGWISFSTNNGSVTEKMRIIDSGNVGIGVVDPDVKLEVAGTIRVGDGGETCSGGNFTGGIRYNGGNLQYCDGTAWQTLGLAGSGITSLTGDVTATGPGAAAATIANDAVTSAKILDGTIATGDLANDAVTYAKIQNVTDNRLLGRSAGSDGDAQEIQIGTGLTMAAGTIALTDTTDDDALGALSCAANEVPKWNGAAWVCQLADAANSNSTLVLRDGAGSFAANNITANGLSISNAGSLVNINTPATANYSLTLPIDDGNSGEALVTNGTGTLSWSPVLTGSTGYINGGNSFGGDATIGLNDNFRLDIETNNTPRITVAADGNVGIGTTNPAVALQIEDGNFKIRSTFAGNDRILLSGDSAGPSIQLRDDGDPVNPTVYLRSSSSYFTGNVGIGVTDPDVQLEVAGTIRVGDGGETCSGGNFTGGIRYNGGNLQFCDGAAWNTLGLAGAGITSLTGDVTATGPGAAAATIANDAVTSAKILDGTIATGDLADDAVNFAKMQNINTQRLLGRGTAAVGDVEEISLGAGLTLTGTTLDVTDGTDDDTLGGLSCAANEVPKWNGAAWVCQLAESANGNSSLVLRDGIGNFASNNITANAFTLNNAGSLASIVSPVGANYTLTLPADDGDAGEALVTNGTGGLDWVDVVSSADGYVNGGNMFAGDASIGLNDNYRLDVKTNNAVRMTIAADGDVGIGTTDPGERLDVTGSVDGGTVGIKIENSYTSASSVDETTYLKFNLAPATVGGLITVGKENDFMVGANRSSYMSFTTRNAGTSAEKMRITADGDVGIGTTNPTAKLTVVTDAVDPGAEVNGLQSYVTTANTSAGTQTVIGGRFVSTSNTASAANGSLVGSYSLGSNGSVGGATTTNVIGARNSAYHTWSGATTNLIGTESSAVNAGIGAVTNVVGVKGYGHHLQGTTGTATVYGGQFIGENGSIGTTPAVYGLTSEVKGGGSSTITDAYGIRTTLTSGGGTITNRYGVYIDSFGTGATHYNLYSAGASTKNYFAGNVGIGTSTPGRLLHVAGPMRLTAAALPGSPATGDIAVDSGDSNKLKWYDGTGWQTVANTSTGGGDFFKDGSVAMTGALQLSDGTAAAPAMTFAADLNTGIFRNTSDGIAFATNGIQRAAFSNTVFTLTSLDISSQNGTGAYYLEGFQAGDPTAATYSFFGDLDTGMYRSAADKLAFATAGSPRMSIDSSGNVGIGTTSPQRLLHVSGDQSMGNAIFERSNAETNTSNGTIKLKHTTSGDMVDGFGAGLSFQIRDSAAVDNDLAYIAAVRNGADDSGLLYIQTYDGGDPDTQLRIMPDGKVQIATDPTANPASRLDVREVNQTIASGTGIVGVFSTDAQGADLGGSITMGGQDGVSSNRAFANISGRKENGTSGNYSGYLALATRSNGLSMAERMRIDSSGNVGIGVTDPDVKLEVAGTLKIGNGGEVCAAIGAGGIRYTGGAVEFCDGVNWVALASGSGGATSIDGLSDAATTATSLYMGSGAGNGSAATDNTAVGTQSMPSLTTGQRNVAMGRDSGVGIEDQSDNVAIGQWTLYHLEAGANGSGNTAVGQRAGFNNNAGMGSNNVAIGKDTLYQNDGGDSNVAVGVAALYDSLGSFNIALGNDSGNGSEGDHNIMMGHLTHTNATGDDNVLIGRQVMFNNNTAQTGSRNTIIGNYAVGTNNIHNGSDNVVMGYGAAISLTSGSTNTIIGKDAGNTLTTGGSNILIGAMALTPAAGTSNFLNIGNTIFGKMDAGRVGIGTTNPMKELHLSAADGVGLRLHSTNNNGDSAIEFLEGGGPAGVVVEYDGADGGGTNGRLNIGNYGGTTIATFDRNGNVGIGTTAPAAPLDVRSTSTATSGSNYGAESILVADPGANSTGQYHGIFGHSESATGNSFNMGKLSGVSGSVSHKGTGTLNYLYGGEFSTYSTSTNPVTNTVGIYASGYKQGGSSTNVYGADISGSRDLSGTTTNLIGVNTMASVDGGTATNLYGIKSTALVNSSTTGGTAYGGWFSAESYGTLVTGYGVYIADTVGATNQWGLYQEAATDKNYFAGNVGIGTTNPGYKLDVAGDVNVTGNFKVNGVNIATGGGDFMKDGSVAMTGTLQLARYINGGVTSNVIDTGSSGSDPLIIRTSSTDLWLRTINNNDIRFITNSNDRMRITSQGRVGIGTTDPQSLLHVAGTPGGGVPQGLMFGDGDTGFQESADDTLGVTIAGTNRHFINATSIYSNTGHGYLISTNNAVTFAPNDSDSDSGLAWLDSNKIALSAGGANTLVVDGGNVGIGMTNPGEKLEVSGNVKGTSFISTSDARLKRDIATVDGLESVMQLRGVKWNWKSTGKEDMGVIAQEVEKVFPWAVVTDPNTGLKAVKYDGLVGPMIEATKDLYGMCEAVDTSSKARDARQDREIASLKAENASLKQEVQDLKSRLEKIEQMLLKAK